jgi:23S rRNA pseudouridine2605 synthase
MEERIQKIMARCGLGSRRDCEELIAAGRVKVNGEKAILGTKADAAVDTITVDGRALSKEEPERLYIALNKPRNVLSDSDPDDPRTCVRDLIPVPGHLFTVGRLDFESEGLILMTNDGELANKLTHPRYGHEKEYRVLLAATPDEEQLTAWRKGVVLEDGDRTLPADVQIESKLGKGAWVRVIMREGRKRQIREVGKRIGLPVVRILRVRIGTLRLGTLKPREWRYLTPEEVNTLQSLQAPSEAKTSPESRRRAERNSDRFAERTRHPSTSSRPRSSTSGRPAVNRTRMPSDSSSPDHSDRKPYTSDKPVSEHSDRKPYSSGRSSSDHSDRKPYPSNRPSSDNSDRKPYSTGRTTSEHSDRKPYSSGNSSDQDGRPWKSRATGTGKPSQGGFKRDSDRSGRNPSDRPARRSSDRPVRKTEK